MAKQLPPRAPSRSNARFWLLAAVVWLAVMIVFFMRREKGADAPQRTSTAATVAAPLRPVVEPEAVVFEHYAGSKTCFECHAIEKAAWEKSNHALAERPVSVELDAAAFRPGRDFTHGTQSSRVAWEGESPTVTTLGFGGATNTYDVVRVIGNDPLRQFLVDGGNGRLQTLDTSYDPHRNEWFNVYGNEDRVPGEWGHWTGRGMNWNAMCASCHNTRLRKNYDEATDSYHTTMAEMTVSCEACHGPMKQHVSAYKSGNKPAASEPPDRNHIMQTCAGCHSRRAELTGDFQPGDAYFDHYHLTVPDLTDTYYPDGQVMGENYVFGSFTGSRMHAAGVTCLDCHDPHTTRLILPGNDLCLRCHNGSYPGSPKIDPTAHSFHQADSTGNQCVNCHMPHTTYMQRHPRRDHGFTIPDPLLTKELGIPNACNRCHADQTTDWALAAVEKNYGEKMNRPSRERARVVARARSGDDSVRPEIVRLITGEDTPYWKAVGVNLADRWLGDAAVQHALLRALDSTNALLRAHAARAVGPLSEAHVAGFEPALRKLLNDPVRAVRVNAAWSQQHDLDSTSLAARELEHFLKINADQPAGQLQLGTLRLAQNNPAEALRHFEKAVQWDPNSAAMHHELAVLYSMLNRPNDALASIQNAVRLEPDNAEFQYKLALARNELGNTAATVSALERAVQLDPRHVRAWYNLGLARNAEGRPDEALAALLRAESIDGNDPRIPYARATILLPLGRQQEARAAAERALTIDPAYGPAMQLLQAR